jgi:hypothetical protein
MSYTLFVSTLILLALISCSHAFLPVVSKSSRCLLYRRNIPTTIVQRQQHVTAPTKSTANACTFRLFQTPGDAAAAAVVAAEPNEQDTSQTVTDPIQALQQPVSLDCDPYDPEGSNYCTVDVDASAAAAVVTSKELEAASFQRRIRITVLFALWYILNVGYNIGNKRKFYHICCHFVMHHCFYLYTCTCN